MRKLLVMLALSLGLGIIGLAQVQPQGIIIEPPAQGGLTAEVWVDKATYTVGETIQIHYRVNQQAAVYIWDIDAQGNVRLLFPNQYQPDNVVSAGTHTLPASNLGYRFTVTEPTGTEALQIFATTDQNANLLGALGGSFSVQIPFAPLSQNPGQFKVQIQGQIQGIVPTEADRAYGFTQFQVVSGQTGTYGQLEVNTTPSQARVSLDGQVVGYSPLLIAFPAGSYSLTIDKSGYASYNTAINIPANSTQRIDIVLSPVAGGQPPVAQFSYSPAAPTPGTTVFFDASASYDPDGTIVSYQWDLNGDGAFDASGVQTTYRYGAAGTYNVTLQVRDRSGNTRQATRQVAVQSQAMPGFPSMDGQPGVYVWGIDTWNITVNGSPNWPTAHPYRIELKTDGEFINTSTSSNVSALGIVPTPTNQGWMVVYQGDVATGRFTYSFQLRNATSMQLSLQLDTNGDGSLDQSRSFVHLRQSMVSPPSNPFVIGAPTGYSGQLVPTLNFRLGQALTYNENVRFVFYSTTIQNLEQQP